MSILIGADIVPTKRNVGFFCDGNIQSLAGDDLLAVLDNSDYRIFNLEVPLTDCESPIEKCGPNLIAPTAAVKGYKALGVDFVTLANNHILDQGDQGLKSTCKILKDNDINFAGVGNNIKEAEKPFYFYVNGKKYGVYACAEHEFSIATGNSCGANPYDPLYSFDNVENMKTNCDFAIVLYHGGKEHYRYPSPNLQTVCRKFVEKGADLVVCQHSHCIGCEEKYQNATIVYGQGNFLFDNSNSEFWQTSLLISIDDDFNVSYIPLTKKEYGVRLAEKDAADRILKEFFGRSDEIKHPQVIEEKYNDFSKEMFHVYLLRLSGMGDSFLFRVLNKLTKQKYGKWSLKRKFSGKRLSEIQNVIECEAHRELFLNGFDKNAEKK